MRALLFLAALVLAGGCDAVLEDDDFILTTDRLVYAAGADVELRLKNSASMPADGNMCFSSIVEIVAPGIERPIPEPSRVCPAIAVIVPSGEEITGLRTLPSGLAPGTYRIVKDVRPLQDLYGPMPVYSNTFEVL